MKSSSYFLIVVLLLMAAVISGALTFPYLESKLLPILLGSTGFILAGIQLWREVVVKGAAKTALKEEQFSQERVETGSAIRRFSSVLGWILGFFLGIYLLGFFIAIPAFVLSYLKRCGRGWLTAIILAGILTVLIYIIFDFTLKIELHRGLVFHLLGA